MIIIEDELFKRLVSSLESMTDYADDGQVSRNDPDFKEFYDAVDEARDVINEAYNVMLKESEKEEK